MKTSALFLDIGGVLLTNGWDTGMRQLAAATFHLDLKEMESRHRFSFDTYEIGKMTLDEYLDFIVFYEKRDFSPEAFKRFMFRQSVPYWDTIHLLKALKKKYNLKVVAVNNEGKELNDFRINKFKLDALIDFFVSSCTLHLKKPNLEIWRLSLELARVKPQEVIYIDDRLLMVETAKKLKIPSIHHKEASLTKRQLEKRGLRL